MPAPNAVHATDMTAKERLAEIGQILARGLIRLVDRKSSQLPGDSGDSSLAFSAPRSGHAPRTTARKA
jgi:hypothetical protein